MITAREDEIQALQNADTFLYQLATGCIKRVPKSVRDEALDILRHYPGKTSLETYWKKDKKSR